MGQTEVPTICRGRIGGESIWKDLKGQIYLGDDDFVEQGRGKLEQREEDVNIPRMQQRPPMPTLKLIRGQSSYLDQGIRAPYETGAYSYQQIADHFGVHFTTVGRIVKNPAQRMRGTWVKIRKHLALCYCTRPDPSAPVSPVWFY